MSAIDERDAYAATVADARSFLRGKYKNPMAGTLAHEISERQRDRFLDGLVVACCVVAAILLIVAAGIQSAGAQTIDRWKPAAISAPISGLYIDPIQPSRYCVAQTGVFQPWGVQTFLHCAAGFNNAGHTFVAGIPVVGTEYALYRLAGETLLIPTVVNSVTITAAPPGEITVRFGSPGAQSPAYTLILQ